MTVSYDYKLWFFILIVIVTEALDHFLFISFYCHHKFRSKMLIVSFICIFFIITWHSNSYCNFDCKFWLQFKIVNFSKQFFFILSILWNTFLFSSILWNEWFQSLISIWIGIDVEKKLLTHSPDKLLMNDFHIYRANRLLPLTPFFTVWRNKLERLNRK